MTNSAYRSLILTVGFVLGLLLCTLTATPSTVDAAVSGVPARPANYVVDMAGVINPNVESGLNGFLRDLEAKTGAQAIVLTVKSLEGGSIDDFSLRVAEQWKLGRKDQDNGLLFTVAIEDRKYRFEVGYGLEGVLPDSFVGSIGREHLVAHFRKGDYSTGIASATLAVIGRIADNAEVEITGFQEVRRRVPSGAPKKPSLIGTIFTVLFIIGAIILFIKNPRLFMWIVFMMMMSGGRGRGGGWSGGGGFGGGGGGGFGGGGASGGW
ncbi:MAG: TPM domain-containing protein [Proteobacteria bacterium]|nr:TPM domain-containing protein [Pseudomonadota bacterium]